MKAFLEGQTFAHIYLTLASLGSIPFIFLLLEREPTGPITRGLMYIGGAAWSLALILTAMVIVDAVIYQTTGWSP